MRVGISVSPRRSARPTSRSISRRCSSSFRGRSGSWFCPAAGAYGGMCALRSHTSPRSITAYASPSWAFPSRSDLTSVPVSSIPQSKRSSSSNLWRARRFVATSPDSGLRLAICGLLGRDQVHASARRIHGVHADADRVPKAQCASAPPADQRRLGLVQVESLPAQQPHWQQALVDVGELAAEAHECPGADHPGHLSLEASLPARFEQLPPEQERRAHPIGVALDRDCLPLALGASPRGLPDPLWLGFLLSRSDREQEGPVGNEVRVPANRRSEVRVVGAPEPGMPLVSIAVVGLLQGSQHERCIRVFAMTAPRCLTRN